MQDPRKDFRLLPFEKLNVRASSLLTLPKRSRLLVNTCGTESLTVLVKRKGRSEGGLKTCGKTLSQAWFFRKKKRIKEGQSNFLTA